MKQDKPARVILRADDVHGATTPVDLRLAYGQCWEKGLPVCLAVIPRSAYRFGGMGIGLVPPIDIRDNPDLIRFVAKLCDHRPPLAEITLHGWQHRYGEMAEKSVEPIQQRIEAGLAVLRDAWPDLPVRVLVPPHDYLSRAGLRAARQVGLMVCSTWAATRGGTRLAHWWGQFRRWRGRPFAPARRGLWATDVSPIDFDEERADDGTERLLDLARRWGSPVVLVQHYWRLLDTESRPNARHARWLDWLERMLSYSDVQFVRFSDNG
jgi:hypothetical protein